MSYILPCLVLSLLAFSLNASESMQAIASPEVQSEFQYIAPLAVEEAPTQKAVSPQILDSDGDGVLDDQDKCPNTKSGESVNEFGCLVKKDADKDGISDDADECPNTPENLKVDTRGCELDSDGDGVVDSKDKCPNTSKEFKVDGFGCPQTATLKVTFETNKHEISEKLISQLQAFALFLKENTGYQVIIYGHTDSTGDAKKNEELSQNRANSVKEALTRYGINASRLRTIGKGMQHPIADNKTKEGRAKNRRIDVELIQ